MRDWLTLTDWSSFTDGIDFHLLRLSIRDTSVLQSVWHRAMCGKSESEDIGDMGHTNTRLDLGPQDQLLAEDPLSNACRALSIISDWLQSGLHVRRRKWGKKNQDSACNCSRSNIETLEMSVRRPCSPG